MTFWTKDNVIQVHAELSTFCNAACPSCPRFISGTKVLRPGLELQQITLEKFKKYFKEEFIKRSTQWLFCGTHGDPMMAKDAIEIFEYVYSINPDVQMRINTNGGMRKEKDWHRLGKLSANVKNKFTITFSIDGLEDTNHLYRRQVDWHVLMNNVKAYIQAGGIATWDFLVYKHNEHQIQEAIKIAENLGFKEFTPKRALGFEYDGHIRDIPVWDEDGNHTHTLEPSTISEYRNFESENIKSITKMPTESHVLFYKHNRDILKEKHKETIQNWDGIHWNSKPYDFENYNQKLIKCKSNVVSMHNGEAIYGREIFVTAEGIVGPCCYAGTQYDVTYLTPEVHQLQKKLYDYGIDNFDLNKKDLNAILEEGHLNNLFASSWGRKNNDKMLYCASACGENSHVDRIWKKGTKVKFNR
jgi:MoaA/NifB/PqqE/SkfB family radical SAM enzyme